MSIIDSMDPNPDFIVRLAVLTDAHAMSCIAANELCSNNRCVFYQLLFPSTDVRPYARRIQSHFLDPRSLSLVATSASDRNEVVGYALLVQMGDQQAPVGFIFALFAWILILWMYFTRIVFHEETVEGEEYWTPYRRQWYVKSVVVQKECRRKGIGRLLLRKIMDRAAVEGVPLTLEATEKGEQLYAKLGFELVERTGDGARMKWVVGERTRERIFPGKGLS